MTAKRKHFLANGTAMIAVLLLLTFGILASGVTLCRYITSFDGVISFSPEPRAEAYITEDTEWTAGDGGFVKGIRARNFEGEEILKNDAGVRVRIYTTEESPISQGAVALTVLDKEYTATSVPINEGTAAHKLYGSGQAFRFIDTEEKEIVFTLSGGEQSALDLILTIQEEGIDTTGIYVAVETIHMDGGDLK